MTEKPGYKTSEFWMTALVVVAITLLIAMGRISTGDVLDLWPVLGSVVAYSLSRGQAKSKG